MAVSQTESGWLLETRVSVSIAGFADEEAERLHDVTLLAYDPGGDLVCEQDIGDITDVSVRIDLEIECSGFPAIITFDAAESPCREFNRITVAVYDGYLRDGGHHWDTSRERKCKEGLPPDVDPNTPAVGNSTG